MKRMWFVVIFRMENQSSEGGDIIIYLNISEYTNGNGKLDSQSKLNHHPPYKNWTFYFPV